MNGPGQAGPTRPLARLAGVCAEPAPAAAMAGIRAALEPGQLDGSEHVVGVISGSGLNEVRAADDSPSGRPAGPSSRWRCIWAGGRAPTAGSHAPWPPWPAWPA